jgi:hypothetical protein
LKLVNFVVYSFQSVVSQIKIIEQAFTGEYKYKQLAKVERSLVRAQTFDDLLQNTFRIGMTEIYQLWVKDAQVYMLGPEEGGTLVKVFSIGETSTLEKCDNKIGLIGEC